MKFQPDSMQGASITGYGPGWIAVDGERLSHSVVLSATGYRARWDCTCFEDLQEPLFAQLADLNPELVIFGSGERIRFPQAAWLQTLYARRIGVETMDTQAACRTYNFLAGEGRLVVAALLVPR